MPDQNTPEEENGKAPQFFVHESENFNSLYFGDLPETIAPKKEKDGKKIIANLITLLTDPRNSHLRNDVLNALKSAEAAGLLAEILSMGEYRMHRRTLTAACWESGLDFSDHLDVFVNIAIEENPGTCVEAMTVIEQMAGPLEKMEVEEALVKLNAALPGAGEKRTLLEEIRSLLEKHELSS